MQLEIWKDSGMTTISDILSSPSCANTSPSFCDETLSPNGYYYELVSSKLGLENFRVYMFKCFPHAPLLFVSKMNRLIEIPPGLINVNPAEMVPEEFLLHGGLLYWIIDLHTRLTHMNFYSLPILPGRLFVFDSGLDRLVEIEENSQLAVSLLGKVVEGCSEWDIGQENSTRQTGYHISAPNNHRLETYYQKRSTHALPHSTIASDRRGSSTAYSDCTSYFPASDKACFLHHCSQLQKYSKFSVADISVYEPLCLDVPLPIPSPQAHCSAPPCVYSGMNDDPR